MHCKMLDLGCLMLMIGEGIKQVPVFTVNQVKMIIFGLLRRKSKLA